MDIVIVNAVYPPEPVVSARLGQDLAEHLNGQSHRVTVVCPRPTRPLGATYAPHDIAPPSAGKPVIHRVPSWCEPRSHVWGRIRESWSFGRQACRAMHDLETIDLVYANTWPLLSQWYVSDFCRRRGIPLVLHIQDLYPESLLNRLPPLLGEICSPPLMRLERAIARNAAHVVVVSESMMTQYVTQRQVDDGKVSLVPNWIDSSPFESAPSREEACRHYGIPAMPFTFLYFGNIGPVAGVDLLIRAFASAALPESQLVIAGDGSQKAACEDMVRTKGISGVFFVSDPRADRGPLIQQLGHVSLLPIRRGAASSSVPSKLMTYMLAGSPIIAPVDSESDTAAAIRSAGGGWVGPPEDVTWLAATMANVTALPKTDLKIMGGRNLDYGRRAFSKESGVRRLADVLFRTHAATASRARCSLRPWSTPDVSDAKPPVA
jgi:glycosyltransferase involved in cell wall biosynthesis